MTTYIKCRSKCILYEYIIQICSGIARGRVLNGELYAQRLQKLIHLHLSADCFMKISLHHYQCHVEKKNQEHVMLQVGE